MSTLQLLYPVCLLLWTAAGCKLCWSYAPCFVSDAESQLNAKLMRLEAQIEVRGNYSCV